jgi:HAE1 family hydrophobic/amphiphilic exporter-1
MLTTIGTGTNPVTKGTILVKTVKKAERTRGIEQIMQEAREEMRRIPGANFGLMVSSGMGGNQKEAILSVRGEDFTKLQKIAAQVEYAFRTIPGAADVENSFESSKPEVRLAIDREKASDLGINVGLIASSARAMVDGYVATKYQEGEEQYDVRVRLNKADRSTIEDVRAMTIKGTKDAGNGQKVLIPLGSVAKIQQASGPSTINRYDRQREIRIDANLSGRALGDVLGDAQSRTREIALSPGYSIKVIGMGEMQAESFKDILMSLGLAIVFVYIVLAMQFESFKYPFSIMLALPMSLIGAIFALLIFDSTLSVMSLIGIIMLMGLVTKNGILLVDFANVLRDRGHERSEALIMAGATRLRPILMTTFAMIFGMMPVAFAFGEGSEFRSPMGQAVIGGLITSTLLTLFVVPVVYSILDDFTLAGVFRKIAGAIPGMKRKSLS